MCYEHRYVGYSNSVLMSLCDFARYYRGAYVSRKGTRYLRKRYLNYLKDMRYFMKIKYTVCT